jgi:pyridoxal phosphate enzyme (YggS family)
VFGENRVQEARQKIPQCPGHLEWHMVGHLQTNKVSHAVRLFSMIHSVDSPRLLEAVDRACETAGRVLPVCLEVNVSGERSKFGLKPGEVPAVLERSTRLLNVDVVGLMTIPPFTEDPGDARPFFRRLREQRDVWRAQSGFSLDQLSMGMSHDFEVAIEEGATWIRLGTVLFGRRTTGGAPSQGTVPAD